MLVAELPAYSERYASAIRWANKKYPQLKFVYPLAGGAVVLQEVQQDDDAWTNFMSAEASPKQIRKLGTAVQIAHEEWGIKDIPYIPHRSTMYASKGGRGVYHFGDDFLGLLLDGPRLRIDETVSSYAYSMWEKLGNAPNPVTELMSGRHPELVAPLHDVWQASSQTLHSESALAIGQELISGLVVLDPASPMYRKCRSRLVGEAGRELSRLIAPAMIEAADPTTFNPELLHAVVRRNLPWPVTQ